MPERALRPCSHHGCGRLTREGRCDQHRRKAWARTGNEPARVRGRALQERRAAWFEKYPLCGDRVTGPSPEHSECVRTARISVGVILDHIKPLAHGGADTPENFQSLCRTCAAAKDLADRGAKPRVRVGEDGWPADEPPGDRK